MKQTRGKTSAIVAGAGLLLVAIAAWRCRDDLRAWWVGYRFIWMPDGVIPASVNASGQAAVSLELSAEVTEAGSWSLAARGFTTLGTLPDGDVRTRAYVINDRGCIIGSVYRGGDHLARAFLWSKEGGMKEIPKLGGQQIAPIGLNNKNQVVGWAHPPGGEPWRAFVWSPDAGIKDLGALLGGRESQALAINENGWVVGNVTTAGFGTIPFVWKPDSGMRELSLLTGFTQGAARDINDGGEVLVDFSKAGPTYGKATYFIGEPYLWTEAGGYVQLPVPQGYDRVEGVAINNRGAVLLHARRLPSEETEAFLVTEGVLKRLPSAIENGLTYYEDINDLGWLVGGVEPRGNEGKPLTRGFLAKPIW